MLRVSLVFILLFFSIQTLAESNPYNRVDFQIETSREVSNDLLIANMSVEIQDKRPNFVAEQINTAINSAIKNASAFKSVKVSSGNQQTRPVYGKNNKFDAWRGHAEIRLESRDFKEAGELIMVLQQHMQLAGIQFTVAPDTRSQIENELIAEVIKKFQARASAICTAMGASSYKNVSLSIKHDGTMPVPYPISLMRGARVMDATIPAPEFAAGESRMTINVIGIIELQ